MRKKLNIIEVLKKNYGVCVLVIYILLVVAFAVTRGDNIYITINDNMDSNIPIYKMIRDNKLFWKLEEYIPFLGGVIARSQYKVELSIQSWIYALFPTLQAYYIVYILKVLLSGLGFYFLAKRIKEFSQLPYINANLWCVCGGIYGILGAWPHAALGFASLPWWCMCVYTIYKTRKKRYIPILLVFVFTTSFTMLALFALFYTVLFIFVISLKEHRVNIPLALGTILLSLAYIVANSHHVLQGINSSSETIKSLKSATYAETIFESLSKFGNAFLFKGSYYHTGGATLRYVVIPVCSVFLIWFIYSCIRKKLDKCILWIYVSIYAAIILNTLACCFDNNALFRKMVPFASGFSFARFAWLSPFFWIILFAIVCAYINRKVVVTVLLTLAVMSVVFDPYYNQRDSMYNELYCNVAAMFNNDEFKDGNHEWTWKEYFSEDLFSEIKQSIEYDGSWAVAYGIEPAVLQYNGIKTLDGYYSNYSLEYHDLFQKMIQPELDVDEYHANYWETSSGVRAYLWSPEWEFITKKDFELEYAKLYINIETFREMEGKYIFSRVKIINSSELKLKQIGKEFTSDDSPYKVYVYTVEP